MQPELFFRALGDRTRLQCLLMLVDQAELCVCEMVYALELSQPRISRHLAQLRDQGIVEDERRGQWVYYRLSPDLPAWAGQVLAAARDAEQPDALTRRLTTMPNRPQAGCD
jgi:ArsR family transcriptional regulator, arsenate/arsenite/antimonite-responsive transcriptional repressor